MKRQVLPQERVAEVLSGFVTVELNLVRNVAIAERYAVEGSPALVVLDAGGAMVGGRSGFIRAKELIPFLQECALRARAPAMTRPRGHADDDRPAAADPT
ncbi:MAG: hypothetical protein JSV19_08780 [Phycisphaerales bacterium]|nr:MAG: hypothetical protein JSV19_08780 [Phycisphaerales bacterium]